MGFRIRKSQVAMEFVMMVMLAFMIMILFSIFTREKLIDLREDEEFDNLKDTVLFLQAELESASVVEDGYSRDFSIPSTLEGIEYTITISNGYILGESRNFEYSAKSPDVQGIPLVGANSIRKTEGVVYLNE